MRISWAVVWCGVVGAALAGACEESPTAPAPSAPGAGAGGGAVDWSKVKGADVSVSVDALTRICRLADIYHKGATRTITLVYAGAEATDATGRSYRLSQEEWKGITAMAASSPGGKAAGRAMPANARNYGDGLGGAARFAYEVEAGDGPGTLVLTVVKPLGGESRG